MKPGAKVNFHGSPLQKIAPRDGVFTIERFMPAGDIFNQPMVVLKDVDFGWIPASSVSLIKNPLS